MTASPRTTAADGPITDSALLECFRATRQRTETLAEPLSLEDCALQSMPDASPVKWHLAHTSWFFETFILDGLTDYRTFDPAYRVLFNSYYVSVGDRHPRPERGLVSRPGLADILRYRAHVNAAMEAAFAAGLGANRLRLLQLGINHEEQHQELILTDLKHLFSKNPLKPIYKPQWPLTAVEPAPVAWVPFTSGLHEIGHAGDAFAFDNESPRHCEYSQGFELASRLVTHGDFLAFMADGGYQRPELWLSAGWDCVIQNHWTAPLYWEQRDGEWLTFTLHGMVKIDPHTPVCHLSYFEADAFARWSGARLPTEAEWEIAANVCPVQGNFLESGAFHPLPLSGQKQMGPLAQMFGDVWEWTQSDYRPYPGFRPAPGAVGEYNGKFMCGQYVLRGGSCATPQRHIRPTYRNFFPPHARWQFSGLRLARDAAT
ncbi:MAG: ergothioneine biosynthesis protein EgtB [Betaproteobacteria bacterium]|nr:ergothioneine biosynthesis protein EgtB [Betaproteobacteria bacterium]